MPNVYSINLQVTLNCLVKTTSKNLPYSCRQVSLNAQTLGSFSITSITVMSVEFCQKFKYIRRVYEFINFDDLAAFVECQNPEVLLRVRTDRCLRQTSGVKRTLPCLDVIYKVIRNKLSDMMLVLISNVKHVRKYLPIRESLPSIQHKRLIVVIGLRTPL